MPHSTLTSEAPRPTFESLATPALVIDAQTVRRNIRRLADYAAEYGIGIRPHTKTHKSLRLAAMQLEAGAIGLTAAKVGEAEIMATACDDILIAFPAFDEARRNRIAKLAQQKTVHVAVDSAHAIEWLAIAAQAENSTIGILIDLDVGLGRTGVATPEDALVLAQLCDRTPGLRLDGIMIYPGHIWDQSHAQENAFAEVRAKLCRTIELWTQHGLAASIVSGGSTPTMFQSHLVPELTEIRPGTYVFNDMNTVRGGFCELEDCAARLICTVVSTAVSNQVVVDAGSKTLTSDLCHPARDSGFGHVVELPCAIIKKLSEEHAQIDVSSCERVPDVGDRLTIIPNHICPCINLQDRVWWLEQGGPPESIAVDARGKLS
jgi:D-serine deaminase-like pyridoxal phosphate-dependent protein